MKDLKISKELFNDVTNSKCHEVFIKNEFVVAHSNLGMKMVNIYEFAFKCKEWAFSQGYSYIGNNKLLNIYSKDSQIICIANKDIMNWFDINVDFIACEWILNQQKNNK